MRAKRLSELNDLTNVSGTDKCESARDERAKTQPILVAGSGRSGTTWIANVISAATQRGLLFEPFLHDRQRRFVLLDGREPEYVDTQLYLSATETKEHPRFAQLEAILGAQVHHAWTDVATAGGTHPGWIIKDIRVNLLLGYIAANFPELKIVLVIRDPVSVINSQLACISEGGIFEWEPEFVLDQPALVEDWLSPFLEHIQTIRSSAEKQAWKWCIETYVPLKQLVGARNVLIVSYESLCRDIDTWALIERFLWSHGWSSIDLEQVSQQISHTSRRSCDQIRTGLAPLDYLSRDDVSMIGHVVQLFRLEQFAINHSFTGTPIGKS